MRRSSRRARRRDVEGTSRPLEEIASKAIREMHEIEWKRKGKSVETQRMEKPRRAFSGVIILEPQGSPARETYDEAETGDEEATVPAKWRRRMEETVNGPVAENAAQQTLLDNQRDQMIKVVDLVGRLISWMEGKSESSHQHPSSVSTPRENQPQEASPDVPPDTTLIKAVMKRKTTTTANQPPTEEPASSMAKRVKLARRSGSQGSQKKH